MEKTAEIVIVGGGIIGASIAFHLALKGAKDIILLEKGTLGEGSTVKCVGGIRMQFSTEINIRFSLESLKTWDHFAELTGVDLELKKVGYLFLATTEDEWIVFQANAHLQRSFNIPVELLSLKRYSIAGLTSRSMIFKEELSVHGMATPDPTKP